jgi:hypothetical protein
MEAVVPCESTPDRDGIGRCGFPAAVARCSPLKAADQANAAKRREA